LKEVSKILAESDTSPLNAFDNSGDETTCGINLKESDGLADDAGVNLIAKVGDCSLADVLNLRSA
jgi:hypothetical protein